MKIETKYDIGQKLLVRENGIVMPIEIGSITVRGTLWNKDCPKSGNYCYCTYYDEDYIQNDEMSYNLEEDILTYEQVARENNKTVNELKTFLTQALNN